MYTLAELEEAQAVVTYLIPYAFNTYIIIALRFYAFVNNVCNRYLQSVPLQPVFALDGRTATERIPTTFTYSVARTQPYTQYWRELEERICTYSRDLQTVSSYFL